MPEPINMIPVNSSNLASVGYDGEANVLRVSFKSGSLYEYYDVSPDVHANLMAASSLGSHFYYNIRTNFAFTQI